MNIKGNEFLAYLALRSAIIKDDIDAFIKAFWWSNDHIGTIRLNYIVKEILWLENLWGCSAEIMHDFLFSLTIFNGMVGMVKHYG